MSQSPIHPVCALSAGSLLAIVLVLFVVFAALLIWVRREPPPRPRRGPPADDLDEPEQELLPGDPGDALEELRRRAEDGR